ncbi:unnamed protein product [Natator depressus]
MMIQLEHSSILFAGRVEHRTLHTKGFQGVLGYPDWGDLDVRSAAISSGPGPVLNKLGNWSAHLEKRITLLRVKLVKHFVKQSAHCLPERIPVHQWGCQENSDSLTSRNGSKTDLNGQLRNQKV